MAFLGQNRQSKDTKTIDNSSKTLLANIRFMSVDKPIQVVVITSAVPNEGKTFVAASLARAMATSGKKTVIVESDMRRRSMGRELGTHAQHGVYSVLAGEASLGEAIVATTVPNLFFWTVNRIFPILRTCLALRALPDCCKVSGGSTRTWCLIHLR